MIVILMDFAKKENVIVMKDSKDNIVKKLYVKIIAIIKEYVIKENVIA
jgi:hypothetical protein